MGIKITQAMNGYQFENRENMRNTAKNILNKQGASEETVNDILENTIFDSESRMYSNAQRSILSAASQISLSSNLKETLKYLKSHPVKKVEKEPVLGELWNIVNENKLSDDVFELDIDYSTENFHHRV